MRTKTLALSALIGLLGSASVMAGNVYSINAVGYINVTLVPGFNMISCPLICSPDNTIGTLFNNGGGPATSNQYNNWSVYQWDTALTPASYLNDSASAKSANKLGYVNGWTAGGTITLNPGQAAWVQNSFSTNVTVTFVGTVPQNGSPYLTNVLTQGFNMVSSAIPMSGDLTVNTNTLMTGFPGNNDSVYVWDTALTPSAYDTTDVYGSKHHTWTSNPTTANVTQGFWYQVFSAAPETWVENFAVNP